MLQCLVTCLFLTCAVYAQAQNGTLKGLITDESGALVPGAKIIATSSSGGQKTTTSAADGSYTLTGLVPGKYALQASSPGLTQNQPIAVSIGPAITTLNIALQVAEEKQEITVQENTGPQVSTDPAQNASALVMRGEDLQVLSDDPDDLQADLEALAGPAAGPNGGQIYIDGFTGGDAPLPNKDSIREVRVNQNPFSPQYDSIGFGRIEILTKPGTDQFRGSAYFNYGNGIFNSRNPYAMQKAPFDLKEYGGSLGGPLSQRASFFFDVDRRDIDNGAVINAITLNPSTLAIVDPFTQVYKSPVGRLRFSPRVDYQINPSNTLILRYTQTRNDYTDAGIGNFNLLSQAYNSLLVENAFEVTETAVLSSKVINETHFQFRHQNYTQSPLGTGPAIIVSNSFIGGGTTNGIHDYIHHHYEVQNYTSVLSGAHSWKFGVRLRAVSIWDTSEQNFNGTYTFGGAYAPILGPDNQPIVPGITCDASAPSPTGCETISSIEQYRRTLLFQQMGLSPTHIRSLGGGATLFSINSGTPLVRVGGVDAGLFVGDDWRLKPNLTLSLGLRYETQNNISDHGDFAPRVAFAWSPGAAASSATGRPKFVIRGGSGIFYDRFSEQNVLLAQRFNGELQQQFVLSNPDTFPAVPPLGVLQSFAQTQAIHTIDPKLRAPYVIQSSIGVERQLSNNVTLSVNYTNTHGLHELLTRDINAPLPGTYTGVPGSGVYPYGNVGPIDQIESDGLYNQNQLATSINSRIANNVSLFGYYMLSYARSNTDGISTYPANQYDLAAEYGPASNDVRNRGVIGGSIATKWNFRLYPFITAQSGAPFNIITSQDIYGDTLLTARPAFAADPNEPGAIATPFGVFDPSPLPGERIVPRNYGRGPGQFGVNLRLSKVFGFGPERETASRGPGGVPAATVGPGGHMHGPGGFWGGGSTNHRYNLTLSVSARNVLNHVNPGPIIGNINSPLFGESNQIAGGYGAFAGVANNRRLEFQIRFAF
jgi:hypothetical protein